MADSTPDDAVAALGKFTVGQWIAYGKAEAAKFYAAASAYITRGVVAGAAIGYTASAGVGSVGYHEPIRDWAVRHNFVAPPAQIVKAEVTPVQPITYKIDMGPVLQAVATLTQTVETKFAATNAAVVDSRNMLKGDLGQAIADVPGRTAAATQAALQPALQLLAKKERPKPEAPPPPKPVAAAPAPPQPLKPPPTEPGLLEQLGIATK